MKNRLIILLVIFHLLMLFSCGRKEIHPVPVRKLPLRASYQNINDSIYLSNVTSIECISGQLFLVDINQHVVFCLDTSLNYIQTIGGKGRAPGELLYPLNVFETREGIVVLDAGNRRLNTYCREESHYSFCDALTVSFLVSENRSVILRDSILFMAMPEKESLFRKIDFFSGDTINFGKFYPKIADVERNFRRILLNSENLFSVGVSEPIVEVFSFSGECTHYFDFSDNPVFRNTLTEHKEIYKKNPAGTTPVLIVDASITDSTIYLLITERMRGHKIQTSKILALDFKDDKLQISEILDLGQGRYDSFCVVPQTRQIVAFDGLSSELKIFKL